MTRSKRLQMLFDAMDSQERGEFDGKVQGSVPENYRGLVLEVNDHGNVTLYMQFKNGNRREIASRV